MRLISDIVKDEILDYLDTSLKIKSIDDTTATTQDITFCCLKWLKLYDFIIVDGINYEVIEYINNNSVRISLDGNSPLTLNSPVNIGTPQFFDGTLNVLTNEWVNFSNGNSRVKDKDKLPFVWLVSPTSEDFQAGDTNIERLSTLNLWFVHWSDWTKLNAYRQSESIKPLLALVDEFVEVIERRTEVFETLESYNTRDFPMWGQESADGITQVITGSTLSAVEVGLTATILSRACIKC